MDKIPAYCSATPTSHPPLLLIHVSCEHRKGDLLASKLEYLSASSPWSRFMIFIVNAGV